MGDTNINFQVDPWRSLAQRTGFWSLDMSLVRIQAGLPNLKGGDKNDISSIWNWIWRNYVEDYFKKKIKFDKFKNACLVHDSIELYNSYTR